MTWGAVGVLLAALALTAGCATTSGPGEKPITDFRQVAGAWNGSTTSTSGAALRVSLIIQTNGRYWIAVERNAAFQGQLSLEGGVLRYGDGTTGSWRGKATLLEDRGKEYLRFVHDTGELWIKYERAQ